jgi:hypothetical protein
MKIIKSTIWIILVSLAVVTLVTSCGKKKSLNDAESRIKALQEKGIADSLIDDAKVYLYQANAAKSMGQNSRKKKYTDSLFIFLEKAEASLSSDAEKFRPLVESLRKTIDERKKLLTGLQLADAEKLDAVLDSFAEKGWLVQARDMAVDLDTIMTLLIKDEEHMTEIRPKVIGRWVSQREPEGKYKAMETRNFNFKKDGSLETDEKMKGQTSEFTKEDWQFLSWGDYELKGDTIFMHVKREKCTKQLFHNYKQVKGKLIWEPFEAPTYDSTITNGSKDRYVTFEYIKEFFKKK